MSVALICDLCENVYKKTEENIPKKLPVKSLYGDSWEQGDACPECIAQYECFLCWMDSPHRLPCPGEDE